MALGGVILGALGAPVTLVDRMQEPDARRRTAEQVAAPQIMPLDLVAWALFRRGYSAEAVAAQTGLDLDQAVEAIIRGFRLTLEEG
ncbi:MAG: hypothetical protein QOE87_2209 [Gaiellales bacterium]|nr:hypothetical protein [Gaiellales bacterium]